MAGADPDIPERILITAGADQWAYTLAELRSEAHKTAATVRMVMSRSLAFMADPALAASVLPGPGDGFDIPAFLDGLGTVYLIAEAVSEDPPSLRCSPRWPPRSTGSRPRWPGLRRAGWTHRC